MSDAGENVSGELRRELGLPGAVGLGLGAIIGTGVFVSIGVAAGISGPAVLVAIALAGAVATCNALSSAQLAANIPVSGGTYIYAGRLLSPWLGFSAGWMFLIAKTASAATAALGFAGYSLHLLGIEPRPFLAPLAIASVAALTGAVLGGVRRSSGVNALIVGGAIGSLLLFALLGAGPALQRSGETLSPIFRAGDPAPIRSLLHATALMFVAYTGYGRIATLGEEVRDPARTIPRAIIATLVVSGLLYMAVAGVSVGLLGADQLGEVTERAAAPLEAAAASLEIPLLPLIITLGAAAAMLGVLLNLILGLSRVLLAMGREGDAPAGLARISGAASTPRVAVIVVGVAIGALAAIGDVRTTWTFSAFTILIYYALTNAAALRLTRAQRLFHPTVAWAGLLACLSLAFWVEWRVWMSGLALLGAGLLWRAIFRRAAPTDGE